MGKARYAPVTLIPLVWLVVVTFTASYHKVFDANPRIGFLAHARQLADSGAPGSARLIFNDRLDAIVTGVLTLLITVIVLEAAREWVRVLSGKKAARVSEAAFVPSRFAVEEQA